MNSQKPDYISNTRSAVTDLITAIDKLRALEDQRVALDMTNSLDDDVDFAGTNGGITKQDLSGVTTTLNALNALLAQGHATNLYKVKN